MQEPELIAKHAPLLRDIGLLAQKTLLLLQESKFLNDSANDFLNQIQCENGELLFKVVTQDMMKENGTSVVKRKRLEKPKVQVLEKWYVAFDSCTNNEY
jgi:hypothetical protein